MKGIAVEPRSSQESRRNWATVNRVAARSEMEGCLVPRDFTDAGSAKAVLGFGAVVGLRFPNAGSPVALVTLDVSPFWTDHFIRWTVAYSGDAASANTWVLRIAVYAMSATQALGAPTATIGDVTSVLAGTAAAGDRQTATVLSTNAGIGANHDYLAVLLQRLSGNASDNYPGNADVIKLNYEVVPR